MIGTPYLDVSGTIEVKNLSHSSKLSAQLTFFPRGWGESTYHKVVGEVFSGPGQVAYKIEGKWNQTISIIDCKTGQSEEVFKKQAYPENWEFMYGMSNYSLQLNYLPNHLVPFLPPTDTRFRPDQRALENGDFKLAASEKHRLEEKQRAVRRYNEKHKIEHMPKYFERWQNPDDPNHEYYRYNGLYFENDRIKGDWTRLPDLYSERLLIEIEEFEKGT